jgi:hypothetical protein
MATRGAYTVADLPEGLTAVHCPKCGFADSCQRRTLLTTLGPNMSLPKALVHIAQCPHSEDVLNPCGIRWGAAVAISRRVG